jgi:hypothetical protein
MRKLFQFKLTALIFAGALLLSSLANAQKAPKPLASPGDSVSGVVGSSKISINYGSPSVRGRKIWGGLVPYDKIWRTGANEATIFTTSKAIKVEGKTLPAGKYSLFTVPGKTEWKFIFNSQTGQWGIKDDYSANDDPKKDVLTVTVKSMKSAAFSERMKFKIDNGFVLLWENLAVPVKIN